MNNKMNNNAAQTALGSTPHQKDLRRGRVSQSNQIYHITTATLNRTPIFKVFQHARDLTMQIKASDDMGYTNTLAFVIMPDHIHWLFQLNQIKSLSKTVQSLKSLSSRAIGQSIWQAGYYDHATRKEEDIQTIARYIIANPVRAGLVKRVGDYPHWDAIWL
ncbi:transposase [Methylotenera sp.]|uniref:REP-associated tyrosine transposase n=1 Tax=Methylotenera sp. TaxID=2051956 RepID=UPI0024893E6C|nr:transposase [Methylotenera sp.]MDI1298748.1 transposase [Methylotenera sp.]